MRCVIVLNGEKTYGFELKKDDHIVSCDAAYSFLKEIGVEPNVILGDFDSLGFVPENAIVYPVEKDMTDGELAVEYIKDKNFDEVAFICFGGKRDDHFLGNLSLLVKCSRYCDRCYGVTAFSKITYIGKGLHKFFTGKGKTVSLFTFDSCVIGSGKGFGYPYEDTRLKCDSTLGISNVTTEEEVFLSVTEGSAFFIENHKQI